MDQCDLKKVVVGGLLRIRDGGAKGKVAVPCKILFGFYKVFKREHKIKDPPPKKKKTAPNVNVFWGNVPKQK